MQSVFKRNEKKYLITNAQAASIESILSGHMVPDMVGTYWVQNIYFDNNNWDVINTSMSKPFYKEKIRLRCYGTFVSARCMFLELKKKYDGIVYKRRAAIPKQFLDSVEDALVEDNTQIARELLFHLQSEPIVKKMFISYHRTAFTGIDDDSALRITFDKNVRYRLNKLNFLHPREGFLVFPEDAVIMEIKTPLSIPLWLARFLSENEIFGTSVSKYGVCFSDYWKLNKKEENAVA
jgi:hypothetical protein